MTAKPKAKTKAKPKAKTAKKPVKKSRKVSLLSAPKRPRAGQPTKYRPAYIDEVRKLYLLGATVEQLLEIFEVSRKVFYEWQKKYPEFKAACRAGRIMADAEVANGLYHRAIGAVTLDWHEALDKDGNIVQLQAQKMHPPETHAAKWWLKNRQPETWKESIEVESSTGAFSIVINETLRPKLPTDER